MNKKKKKNNLVKIVLFGIICLAIILAIVIFFNKDNIADIVDNKNNVVKNKNLVGKKIINGLYSYDFEEKDYVQDVIIKNDDIYYLINKENKYKLYKIDVHTNENKEIGTIEGELCILNDYYLTSYKGEIVTIYDTSLKEIYKSEEIFNIIPYQDSFLIIKGKEIYSNNRKIREIKEDIERFDIMKYFVLEDNTFVYFASNSDTYIYNVKDDTYDNLEHGEIYSYEKGIYYSINDKIVVKDLNNNISKEYKNFNDISDLSLKAIKDNMFFYMDYKYLKIYNFETDKYKYLDYKFNKSISQIITSGNYLYIIDKGNDAKIYVVNIDEINSKEFTLEEYNKMQIGKISEKIKEIENKYTSVKIIYDFNNAEDYENWDNELINEDNYERIYEAVGAINNVLDKFGTEFISLFKHDTYDGLRIIIAKKIITGEDEKVKDILGFFFPNYKNYNIIISRNEGSYEKLFSHEMMHAIDHNALNHNYDVAGNWYDYNPKDFNYNIEQYNNGNMEYTTYTYGEEEVYFVDSYSKINQSEDRARVFENMCYIDNGENIIKKYPNLLKKAEYIRDELIKYYPSLKDSEIFDNIKF